MFMVSCNQDAGDGVTCMVNGFVYDVETGLPIEGATVSIGTKKGVTDETGYFVVSGVGSGTYDVGIVAGGYLPGAVDELIVNPGFFREVREADLVYYQSEIAANGAGSQSGISTSGVYQITQNGNTVTIRNNDAADPNTIDSIGDATRYSQTIMAVALRPANGILTGVLEGATMYEVGDEPVFIGEYDIPAGTGLVAYYIPVSFLENMDPDDESVLLALTKEIESFDPEVRSFRTTVAADGSFTFTNVPNGLFFIVVDPFTTEDLAQIRVPQTICFRDKADDLLYGEGAGNLFTTVISGSGDAGRLYALVEVNEDPALKLVSIRAVDRSELPIEADRDIKMTTGGGVELVFNKPLNDEYEDMVLEFAPCVYDADDDVWEWGNPIPGTQYVIQNEYLLGYSVVYVWNDEFSKYSTAEFGLDFGLHYKVSSFEEDDMLDYGHGVETIYHMGIVSTNLYGSAFYGNIVNGKFSPTDNIEITFDQEIPQDASIEVELRDDEGEEVYLLGFHAESDTLVIEPMPLGFKEDYSLRFNIVSADGSVLYSTLGGVKDATRRGVIFSDDVQYIEFTTAAHQVFEIETIDDKYVTNLNIEGYDPEDRIYHGISLGFDPYEDINIMFTEPIVLASAELKWMNDGDEEDWISIPVEVEFIGPLLSVSLKDDLILFPRAEAYYLDLVVLDEELQKLEVTNSIRPLYGAGDQIKDAPTGLESFAIKAPEKQDSKAPAITFEWESEGIHLGRDAVYYLFKVDEDLNILPIREYYDPVEHEWVYTNCITVNEKSKIVYEYDTEFDRSVANAISTGTNYGDDIDDLAFGGTVGFVLMTYDEYGCLIQSPIIWVDDEVAPQLANATEYPLPDILGVHEKDSFVEIFLTASSDELLQANSDIVDVEGVAASVVTVESKIEYYYDFGDLAEPEGHTLIVMKVTYLAAVDLAEGDLVITVSAEDTSGNLSEDFVIPQPTV